MTEPQVAEICYHCENPTGRFIVNGRGGEMCENCRKYNDSDNPTNRYNDEDISREWICSNCESNLQERGIYSDWHIDGTSVTNIFGDPANGETPYIEVESNLTSIGYASIHCSNCDYDVSDQCEIEYV